MEDPFRGISAAKDEAAEDKYQLRSLTDNFVFCPKCGMENSFKLSKEGKKLIYFCKKCKSILNNYWDGYTKKQYSVTNCSTCQQPTFKDLKYCISCGSIQRITAIHSERPSYLRPEGISKSKKFERKELIPIICALFLMAPGVLLFGIGLMYVAIGEADPVERYLPFGLGIALIVIPVIFILILQIIKYTKKRRELSIKN